MIQVNITLLCCVWEREPHTWLNAEILCLLTKSMMDGLVFCNSQIVFVNSLLLFNRTSTHTWFEHYTYAMQMSLLPYTLWLFYTELCSTSFAVRELSQYILVDEFVILCQEFARVVRRSSSQTVFLQLDSARVLMNSKYTNTDCLGTLPANL